MNTLSLTIEDEGVEFNPLNAPEADVSASIEQRTAGGLGIFLVRQLMEEVTYERNSNRNRLVMKIPAFGSK